MKKNLILYIVVYKIRDMEAKNIYHMVYLDSSRKESERDLTLDRVKFSGGKLYLFGYCHLRQSFREFSVSGIKKILKDNVEIENIEEYFLDLYFQSDDGKELMKYKGFKFLFDFLWLASKTCTPIDKEEKEILFNFAKKINPKISKKSVRLIDEWNVSQEEQKTLAENIKSDLTAENISVYNEFLQQIKELKLKKISEYLNTFDIIIE